MVRVSNDLPAGCKIIDLAVRGDERGLLVALESATGVPFDIARAYFIYDTVEGVVRGRHAHREIEQLAVCVTGGCTMLLDDGTVRSEVRLDSPDRALLVPPLVWHEMSGFTPGAVLLVLASAPYDERDYIRDYAEFQELARR
jgi:dTDP-4-dehydrorhamnose 3,5-epimerase-like enzyme